MNPPPAPELVAPQCGPTVGRLQDALDGGDWSALDADPHAAECTTCRARARAARMVLAALATPEPIAVPNFTDRVLAQMKAEPRRRGRIYAVAAVVAIAAAVLIAVWAFQTATPAPDGVRLHELVGNTTPAPQPAPQPVRINDELAKAGEALWGTTRPLTEPAVAAPKMFASISLPFARPAPVANLEPARKTLADIPDAARVSFEPVTDSAAKAFARLVRDVSGVKPKS